MTYSMLHTYRPGAPRNGQACEALHTVELESSGRQRLWSVTITPGDDMPRVEELPWPPDDQLAAAERMGLVVRVGQGTTLVIEGVAGYFVVTSVRPLILTPTGV